MGLSIIGAFPPAPSHTVHAVLPHTAFPRTVDDSHSAAPMALARHPSGRAPRPRPRTTAASWEPESLLPADAETTTAHPATGPSLGQVLLSIPVIATTPCADFRCARDRFVGRTYRSRLLPGTAGWQTCSQRSPVRRRISPVPCSTLQTFRSPYAEGFLGAALPSSSPRPWPSPCGARLGSLFVPPRRGPLRRGRIRFMLRTACSLDPKRAFVVTLQRSGSLLALATSYTAAWSLR
jgi:hypothetical protein